MASRQYKPKCCQVEQKSIAHNKSCIKNLASFDIVSIPNWSGVGCQKVGPEYDIFADLHQFLYSKVNINLTFIKMVCQASLRFVDLSRSHGWEDKGPK